MKLNFESMTMILYLELATRQTKMCYMKHMAFYLYKLLLN